MKIRITSLVVAVVLSLTVSQASASYCEAHFPFDGTLNDVSGNGYDGTMIAAEGEPGSPQFVRGKFGEALHVSGGSAMRSLLDLHFEACPQFTITAWFRLPSVGYDGPQYIVSTGSRGGIPSLRVNGQTLILGGKGNGLAQKNAVRDGNTWFFVAASFDYEAKVYKLYWRNRSQEGGLGDSPYQPEDSFWVGTRSDKMYGTAQSLYIDELRVHGRVLSRDEIRTISTNRAATGPASSGVSTGLQGPIDRNGSTANLSMPDAAGVQQLDGKVEASRIPGASGDAQTIEEMRESSAARNPLSDATRDAIEERGNRNRPPDLTAGTTQGGQQQESDPSPAPVTTIPHPAGNKYYSGISGTRGDIVRELELFRPDMRVQGTFDKAWLTGIQWEENGDRPCRVMIEGLRPIEYSGGRVHEKWDTDEQLSGCSGGDWIFSQGPGHVELNQGSPSPQTGGDATAIGQIQLCHNDRNNRRMKGLRIVGSHIRADGTLTVEGNADATQFSNCRSWAQAVICPPDTLGTGLVVHATEASGSNQQIVGLQLICRDVSVLL